VLQVATLLEDPEEPLEFGLWQELGEFAFLPGLAQAELPPGQLADVEEVGVVEPFRAGQANDLADDVRLKSDSTTAAALAPRNALTWERP
jgi:hypothetical protein